MTDSGCVPSLEEKSRKVRYLAGLECEPGTSSYSEAIASKSREPP